MKPTILLVPAAALLAATSTAAPLKSATVTKVVNDVRIYGGSGDGQTASGGEKLGRSNSVHTGRRSRAELTFSDTTLTRIGANSVFSMAGNGRDIELRQGTMLIQVPENSGGATIRTATVTASITGSTALFEFFPGKWVKLFNVEGHMKLGITQTDANGKKKTVFKKLEEGQGYILPANGRGIPSPFIINMARMLRTSPLTNTRYFPQMSASSRSRIDNAIARQMSERRAGNLAPSGVILNGTDRPAGGASSSQTETPVRDTQMDDHHGHIEPPFYEPPFEPPFNP